MAEGRLCPLFWEVLVLFMKVAHQGVARLGDAGVQVSSSACVFFLPRVSEVSWRSSLFPRVLL